MGLLPRIAEVWLRNRKRLCAEPRFVCAIPGLLRKSSDPSFVYQNPWMVQIHTLHITYIILYLIIHVQYNIYINNILMQLMP